MELVQWNKQYETGFQEIDDQHKQLAAMLNQLYSAYIYKQNDAALNEILKGLQAYAQVHFQTEERLMRIYNYEQTDSHIIEHKNFIRKVKDIAANISSVGEAELIDIINFMRGWLIHHIQGSDRGYIDCFKRQGLM